MSSRCRRIGEADQPTFDEGAIRGQRDTQPNIKALRIAVFRSRRPWVSAIQYCQSSNQQTGHILCLKATKFVSI